MKYIVFVMCNFIAIAIFLIFYSTMIDYAYVVPAYLMGIVMLNVAIWGIVREPDGDDEQNPKLLVGRPPSQYEIRIRGKKVMGTLVAHASLVSPRELLATGPNSVHRLNPEYCYEEVRFAEYAGLYRVPWAALDS